jgi:hypothetical protein
MGDPAGLPDEILHTATACLAADSFDVIHDHAGVDPTMGAMLEFSDLLTDFPGTTFTDIPWSMRWALGTQTPGE